MVHLHVFILAAFGLATVSASISFGSPPSQPSPSYEWTVQTPAPAPGIFDKLKKGKKWDWLPSWPWKNNKKEAHEVHHEITHYPVWKIHKYKGIEIRPVKVVDVSKVYPPPQVHIHPYVQHNEHIHHKSVAPVYYPEIHHVPHKEISAPVYHHEISSSTHPEVHDVSYQKEISSPVYHHQVHPKIHYEPSKEISTLDHPEVHHVSYQAPQKEIPLPVYHQQVHPTTHYESPKEISAIDHPEEHHISYQAPPQVHHISYNAPQKGIPAPVYHHEEHGPEYHDVENHVSEQWKAPEIGESQWAQLTTPEERSLFSSFIGEGHSIEMLQKLMPTLVNDKNLFNRMKALHSFQSNAAPVTIKETSTEKKPKTLFTSFLPSFFSKHSPEPEHQEIHHHAFASHQPHGYFLEGQAVQGHESLPELPEVEEVYAPGFQNLHLPEIPDTNGAFPFHQSTPLTVVEYSNPQSHHQQPQQSLPHQPQPESQVYEEKYPPYPQQNQQQLYNSYGEPIPNDSYSSPSNKVEISALEPRAQQSQPDGASSENSGVHESSNEVASKSQS